MATCGWKGATLAMAAGCHGRPVLTELIWLSQLGHMLAPFGRHHWCAVSPGRGGRAWKQRGQLTVDCCCHGVTFFVTSDGPDVPALGRSFCTEPLKTGSSQT